LIRRGTLIIILISSLGLLGSRPASALKYEGLPGSTWGAVYHDNDQLVGTGTLGYVNQGIDWVTLPGAITVNTYVEFRYRFRSENNEFYNAYSEAVGLEFQRSPFHLGVDYAWERFPPIDEQSNKFQYYLTWFYDWDLNRGSLKSSRVLGYPGSVWGTAYYDNDSLVGSGTLGYINQGINWVTLPGKVIVNTFAEFRFQLRSANKDFYNTYSEAVGVELQRSPFHLGMDYVWQRFPVLGEQSNKLQFYLTWYYDWDLMKKSAGNSKAAPR